MSLPSTTTPEELAERMGWSKRRLKAFARELGACHVLGNRMILTEADVGIILFAAKPTVTLEDVREWLGQDGVEIEAEAAAQSFAEPTGVVYFVARGSEVKIGFTGNIAKRLTSFRTATTEKFELLLTIPGTPVLEPYFHEKFAPHRIEREWFRLSGEIEQFIARRLKTRETLGQ